MAQRQVVAGREAHHPAQTPFGFGDEKAAVGQRRRANVGQQRGEVVVENVDGLVRGSGRAAGAGVARAEVAVGVVGRTLPNQGRLDLALPGSGGAVR